MKIGYFTGRLIPVQKEYLMMKICNINSYGVIWCNAISNKKGSAKLLCPDVELFAFGGCRMRVKFRDCNSKEDLGQASQGRDSISCQYPKTSNALWIMTDKATAVKSLFALFLLVRVGQLTVTIWAGLGGVVFVGHENLCMATMKLALPSPSNTLVFLNSGSNTEASVPNEL